VRLPPFALALGLWRRGVKGLLDLLLELLRELCLRPEKIAERELQLARQAPLGLVAVQSSLEQRVLVREVRDRVLERRDLDRHLRLEPRMLRLELRDQRHDIRRLRRRGVVRGGHASPLHAAISRCKRERRVSDTDASSSAA
jgi:hypothetical protein